MPTTEERLKVYGLKEAEVDLKDLTVRAGQTVVIGKRGTVGQFKALSTKSFVTLKEWIGVSDKHVKENPHLAARPSAKAEVPHRLIPMMAASARPGGLGAAAKFTPVVMKDMKVLAHRFVFGDSTIIHTAAELLQQAYGKIDLGAILFLTIEVQSGGVLEIDPDVHILWAHKLKIHDGGKIKVHLGNTFKLDVNVLEKV
ncbi:MAG: hypothetical protein PHR28_07525 [candidate division Zixibacteria bacterium]|nr:hypothetical protein [candidate division Zixibacteria bacterium]